jgi:hypothetical protein
MLACSGSRLSLRAAHLGQQHAAEASNECIQQWVCYAFDSCMRSMVCLLPVCPCVGCRGGLCMQHPGGGLKQVALRENQLISKDNSTLLYRSDTAPGSSGAPCFNDTWQVSFKEPMPGQEALLTVSRMPLLAAGPCLQVCPGVVPCPGVVRNTSPAPGVSALTHVPARPAGACAGGGAPQPGSPQRGWPRQSHACQRGPGGHG